MNFENNTYRKIYSIFGLHYGKWKVYPEIESITVFKTKQSKSVEGTSSRSITDIINFNIYYSQNKHLTFYQTEFYEDAQLAIKELKINLNIDILDKTTH